MNVVLRCRVTSCMRHSSHRQLSIANENAKHIQPIECCTVLYLVWEWFVLVLPKENHQVGVYGHQIALLEKKIIKIHQKISLSSKSCTTKSLWLPGKDTQRIIIAEANLLPRHKLWRVLRISWREKKRTKGEGWSTKILWSPPLSFCSLLVLSTAPMFSSFCFLSPGTAAASPQKLTVQLISLFCAATFREMCYDLTESWSLCWVGELVILPSGTFATSQFAI